MIGVKKNKQAIVWRIDAIPEPPPPLTMLVNPANLDIQYQQLVNETRTKGGFAQEFWGEQISNLSASGITGMAYNDGGITNAELKDSEAYENFINLLNFYKNNSRVYDSKIPTKITRVGIVIMTYFGKEYEGYFDSFNWKESAEKQYTYEYDLSFKVEKIRGDLIVKSAAFIRDEKNHG